ncbi:E3 ubiquitin-protein ligase RSL1-like [Wolffia australiana]
MEPIAVSCDVCGDLKETHQVCLDMRGCHHLPCFSCLTLHASTHDDGHFLCFKCPVPSCRDGFSLLRRHRHPPKEEISSGSDRISSSDPFFFCPICLERKPMSDSFKSLKNSCDHSFCESCVVGFVKAQIEQSIFSIGCPNPDCLAGKLEIENFHGLIPETLLRKWGMGLCESALSFQVKFYCPFPDCSALLINEGDDEGRPLTEALCLHCMRVCCAQCRVPWHVGKSCEEFKREEGERRERGEDEKVVELARSRKWQRCPKCGIIVERIDGCLFIRCRCKYCFCYRCASPMDSTHFCRVCNLSWDR